MRILFCTISFLVLIFFCTAAQAYKIESHQQMTRKAYLESNLANTIDFEASFGVSATHKYWPRHPANQLVIATEIDGLKSEDLKEKDAQGIIEFGVMAEDDGSRGLNHFLDPQNGNRPISILSIGNSADWSLEDNGDIDIQKVSLKDAYQFYLNGLTLANESDRLVNLGLMFLES